jgi:hypothetical protein
MFMFFLKLAYWSIIQDSNKAAHMEGTSQQEDPKAKTKGEFQCIAVVGASIVRACDY